MEDKIWRQKEAEESMNLVWCNEQLIRNRRSAGSKRTVTQRHDDPPLDKNTCNQTKLAV